MCPFVLHSRSSYLKSDMPIADPADSTIGFFNDWYGGYSDNSPGAMFPSDTLGGIIHVNGRRRKQDRVSSEDPAVPPWQDYAMYDSTIDAMLQRPPEAFFDVQSSIHGGQVHARVQMDSVTGHHPKVYLRLLLVEDTIQLREEGIGYQYDAYLTPRLSHHMVVRAVARRAPVSWALPMQVPGTVQYTFDVAAMQRRYLRYYREGVQGIVKTIPLPKSADSKYWEGLPDSSNFFHWTGVFRRFPDEHDWRINPYRLHVVAYVQDATSGEILQAAMIPINDWSNGERLILP